MIDCWQINSLKYAIRSSTEISLDDIAGDCVKSPIANLDKWVKPIFLGTRDNHLTPRVSPC
ncbi:hypothetical protein NIES22_49910 [Calothrix brevissima NIES-22]|nr:hypothetical protein NIES22_49910 [Calothrix brevissima NIES-22]